MRRIYTLAALWMICVNIQAQDTTMASLTKDMDNTTGTDKRPAKIFSSGRTINANTTEMVGKGRMQFKVTHNFGDIGGKFGGIKNFYGLDNAEDIRIAFDIGFGKRFDATFARAKGSENGRQQKLFELGLKYLLLRQIEKDPSHPISVAAYVNIVAAANKASSFDDFDNSFRSFSDRLSETFQLIIAKKIGRVSIQLNPTFVTRGYAISYDQESFFALGGAIRFPITKNLNFIVDYFHVFRSEETKDAFANPPNTLVQPNPIKFYDPLGAGFEIIAGGHVFNLNFTNATETLENRFIPRTTKSWGKGEFRWGFTISRRFVLWKDKK